MASVLAGQIRYPPADGVVFGPGCARDQLQDLLDGGRCLFAAFMLLPNLLNVGLGVVAGLRHQFGGGLGAPHGVASTIVLPHVLRWNLPAATDALSQTAQSLGLVNRETDAEAAALRLIETVEILIARLHLPSRLRDVNVSQTALSGIAEQTAHDFVVSTNPRPVQSSAELLEVLEAAWRSGLQKSPKS